MITVSNTLQAERGVVASLLRSAMVEKPTLPEFQRRGLTADKFKDFECQRIFKLIEDAESQCSGSYSPQVISALAQEAGIPVIRELLQEIVLEVPHAGHGMTFLNIVLRDYKDRILRSQFQTFTRSLDSVLPADLPEHIRGFLSEFQTQLEGLDPLERTSLHDALERFYEQEDNPENTAITPTQIPALNERIGGGFRVGQMIVVAGRPAMGKSALGVDFALEASRLGPTLFYSLEMGLDEFGARYAWKMKHRDSARAMARQHDMAFVLSAGWTIEKISADAKAYAKEMANKGTPLKMVLVDHLGLIKESGHLKNRTRESEVAHISRSLKLLAQELQVPVIAVCQLNRGNERREDKGPMLSDLRDSGSIEQDADIVMGLFRPSYYDENLKSLMDEIRLLKVRQGKAGTVPARFHEERVTWGAGEYIL